MAITLRDSIDPTAIFVHVAGVPTLNRGGPVIAGIDAPPPGSGSLGVRFPGRYLVDEEEIEAVAGSVDVFEIRRGQNGSTPASHAAEAELVPVTHLTA